jgi:hypothetical protein
VDAFPVRARVGIDGRRAALSRIFDRRTDHRDRDALTSMTAPHRDARDHPGRDIVDGRRRLRVLNAREVVPRSEGDEPDGLTVAIRDQAG